MARTHKDEWKAIEDERKETREDEDRKFQRTLMEKMTGATEAIGTPEAPLYVSDKSPKPQKVKVTK